MIKNRWYIPAAFGVAAFVLAIASFIFSEDGFLVRDQATLESGQSKSFPNLELKKDQRYTLQLQPTNGLPVNAQEGVSAALLSDDAVVFEIEDWYWHERGTWHEGGESGTWEERNVGTTFHFVVPEDGVYALEVSMDRAASIAGDQLEVVLAWRSPWLLSGWPLIIGSLVLFGVAGWSYTTRRGVMGRYIENILGEGSRITLGEDSFNVIGRHEHFEQAERIGVELRLRDEAGQERWLAVDRYWREHPYIEDGDQTVVQILMNVVLSPLEQQKLDQQEGGLTAQHIDVQNRIYTLDKENSGVATMVTYRNGEAYRSRYRCDVYRDEHSFPIQEGERWIEYITWYDEAHTTEWAVMEIIDWTELEVVEIKEPQTMEAQAALQEPDADPFGVRPGDDSFGAAAMNQQQQGRRPDRQGRELPTSAPMGQASPPAQQPFGQQQHQQPFGQQQHQQPFGQSAQPKNQQPRNQHSYRPPQTDPPSNPRPTRSSWLNNELGEPQDEEQQQQHAQSTNQDPSDWNS